MIIDEEENVKFSRVDYDRDMLINKAFIERTFLQNEWTFISIKVLKDFFVVVQVICIRNELKYIYPLMKK